MIDIITKNKWLIMGEGVSTRPFINILKKNNVEYEIYDDKFNKPIEIDYSAIIISPGFNYKHKLVLNAKERNIPIYTDIDIFFEINKKDKVVVGITGTKGKSTLTVKLSEALKNAKFDAIAVGNVGNPILENLEADVYIIELSSFQLYYANNMSLDVGVITSFSEDHLDWHETMEHYRKSKEKIGDFAKHILISNTVSGMDIEGTRFSDGEIIEKIFEILDIPFDKKYIPKNFSLKGRLESLGKHDGIEFINDTNSTIPASQAYALEKLSKPVSLLAGGRGKVSDYSVLKPYLNYIKKAYLFGESNDIEKFLSENNVDYSYNSKLENAFNLAVLERKTDCILLSPGAASFDLFTSAVERGDVFKKLVEDLKN